MSDRSPYGGAPVSMVFGRAWFRVTLAVSLLLAGVVSPGEGVAQGDRFDSLGAAVAAGVLDAGIASAIEAGPTRMILTFDQSAAIEEAAVSVATGRARADDVLAAVQDRFATQKQRVLGALVAAGIAVEGNSLERRPPPVGVLRDFSSLPGMVVQVASPEALLWLLNQPEVTGGRVDLVVTPSTAESLPLIGQPKAAAAGQLGAGTSVAVIDTGVDYTRPAFGSCTSPGVPAGCKVAASIDIAADDGQRDGGSFHGTNVAAVALAVAPSSRIVAVDVFGANGSATSSDIYAALDWVVQNKSRYNIRAVNLSLGGGSYSGACSPDPGFGVARSMGIVPTVASGNNGTPNALAWPACVPGAIAVGAVYDANLGSRSWTSCSDATTAPDRVTCFSNSGSQLGMLAPGAIATAGGLSMVGTSQAAPHVAGAAAVLAGAAPGASADALRSVLLGNGPLVTDARNGLSHRRLDVWASLTALGVTGPTPTPAPKPAVTPTPTPAPAAGTDTTPPVVTARAPTSGARGVATSAAIAATFSEPVKAVSANTFLLRDQKTGEITPATVSYDAVSRRATLRPSRALTAGRTYTAWLSSAITDMAGNRLVSTSWSFTTASATVHRLAGSDRYATAAAISAGTFAPGPRVAYVATGANFPDALAGGPAASVMGGPVLLTYASSVPPVTAAELKRLRPQRIVVLGGTGVVSERVVSQLKAYTVGLVQRFAGPNRYATAARISAATFAAGVPIAYVATGLDFPDPLVGGSRGGPLLLVHRSTIPSETAAELKRLRPQRIVVVGDRSAVPDAVLSALRSYTSGTVSRVSGSDRYATSAALSSTSGASGSGRRVFIATGLNFPDALAGAGVAGRFSGSLLLVPASGLPTAVRTEIERIGPTTVTILGGTGVVSSATEAELRRLVGG